VSDLTKSIQNLYGDKISQDEAEIAKDNLVGFFQVLKKVDDRCQQHKVNITNNVNNKVMESYASNKNNRSSY